MTAAASSAAAQTSTVTATWAASTGSTGYILEYGLAPGVYTQSVNVGNVTSHTLSVTTGQTYYFVVKAYNSGGTSLPSAVATGGVFTDRPLIVGSTPVKLAHLLELRARINAARVIRGLATYAWSEAVTTSTSIKAQHVTEMRTALAAAFAAEPSLSTPTYTDPSLNAGAVIKGVHFTQLRTNVELLEATP